MIDRPSPGFGLTTRQINDRMFASIDSYKPINLPDPPACLRVPLPSVPHPTCSRAPLVKLPFNLPSIAESRMMSERFARDQAEKTLRIQAREENMKKYLQSRFDR